MVGTVIEQIDSCLNERRNFLLSGGAGSGKTYTLVQTLHHVFSKNTKARVACITYTNVAANEIKERSPYSKLYVSTIHDFLWNEIKDYQKNLKQSLLFLISDNAESNHNKLNYSGDSDITENSFDAVQYKNYRDLEHGIITHDDLLKIANHMFTKFPLLFKILNDRYDYIFIDEYQDTQQTVIEIFLDHIETTQSPCIGFFGDRMQSIYESGVGNIQPYVGSGSVCEIVKEDNYRCSIKVIELLNRIRPDIKQKPANVKADGSFANKAGSVLFLYSSGDFDLTKFKTSSHSTKWDFEDFEENKILFLTHRLSASRLGFTELLSAYAYTDNLIGNEPDRLAQHLLNIGGILYHFSEKKFAYVIDAIQRKIKTNSDKQHISQKLTELYSDLSISIGKMIDEFDSERLVRKDDKFKNYLERYAETYDRVKSLPSSQMLSYFSYYNKFSPYSTQHGIKGAEFNNVLVVMDNGRWNNYNFKYYFEETPNKESIIDRTERIFYVCCSRAKDNLVIYYPKPTEQVISRAKILFGEDNVQELC